MLKVMSNENLTGKQPLPTGTATKLPAGADALSSEPAGSPAGNVVPLHFTGPAFVSVCCYCQSIYRVRLNMPQVKRTELSHGICARCLPGVMEKAEN